MDQWQQMELFPTGRCTKSSWRGNGNKYKPYGPGGFNRCIGDAGHKPPHKDEFGNVFTMEPQFKVLRTENVGTMLWV